MEPIRPPSPTVTTSLRLRDEPIRHIPESPEATPDIQAERKFTDVYFGPDFLKEMLSADVGEPARAMLLDLVSLAKKRQATDIHIQLDNSCRLRVNGKICPAFNEKDDGSIYATNKDTFHALRTTIGFENPDKIDSKVFRFATEQIRVQYFPKATAPQLCVRIQPLTPPKLANTLDPITCQYIRGATGLVLVTGPIGSGKTTLASSISQSWGADGKHIYTVEDPVEYLLQPRRGMVTQVNCTMLGNTTDGVTFQEAILNALRSDIDGLFIGEIRTPAVLAQALAFAVAREPVVTTFHAGSLTEALVRVRAMATEAMGEKPASLCMIQGLHSIIYTDLAFDKDQRPVPVTVCLPVARPDVRKLLRNMDQDAESLDQDIEEVLKNGRKEDGFINRDMAMERALAAGATKESVLEALPPEPVIIG